MRENFSWVKNFSSVYAQTGCQWIRGQSGQHIRKSFETLFYFVSNVRNKKILESWIFEIINIIKWNFKAQAAACQDFMYTEFAALEVVMTADLELRVKFCLLVPKIHSEWIILKTFIFNHAFKLTNGMSHIWLTYIGL